MSWRERADAASWAHATFAGAELGDVRRNARVLQLAERMMQQPSQTLPVQVGDLASLKAAYRLLDSEAVSFEALSESHWLQTRARAGDESVVLMIQDTTEIDYTHHPRTEGLGPIGDGRGRGYLLHSVLAVTPNPREVIGIAHQQPFVRVPAPAGETSSRQRSQRQCESQVWANAVEAVGAPPENVRWVHVGDRGSDVFAFLATCLQHGCDFLIRAAQNRRLVTEDSPATRLISTARALDVQDHRLIELPAQHGRPKRQATLALAYGEVSINAPFHSPRHDPIQAWVIRVWELDPTPQVEEPIEWLLVTSVPTDDLAKAWQHVAWYRLRWIIEDYHRCLKTGCRVEERHLGTYDRLKRLLGILAPLAVHLLQWRDLAQAHPDRLARDALPADVVTVVAHLAGLKAEDLTVGGFWLRIAKQGGYLGRRNDGPPGWQAIWRGWSHILVLLEGLHMAASLPP